ncbi:MAG: hypothetical protein UU77_C0013G0005 [candidate division WWE3 bacterium GW2011_GWC1_41_7]|uniref:Uncharacterized protein n=3 Tax=Katanobacteria TaxID=422282 RepID=A0A0G0X7H0_UNCKA|nr:MAG: hypothetical protein UU72_C0019G0005 [candidate division WWE3 bacterium GW2011_GWB1_41_6]KKS20890.1 MAG: hypothetical protein UU77_C0013G0005 [candidate division WWE3 bacterium GW2011_GWC1_41_7]KKS21871.1 MAG: hypothetical protein UU80_C0018G0007 [candidate division WWE3 bacterium GW2011_GWA1_41_8]
MSRKGSTAGNSGKVEVHEQDSLTQTVPAGIVLWADPPDSGYGRDSRPNNCKRRRKCRLPVCNCSQRTLDVCVANLVD